MWKERMYRLKCASLPKLLVVFVSWLDYLLCFCNVVLCHCALTKAIRKEWTVPEVRFREKGREGEREREGEEREREGERGREREKRGGRERERREESIILRQNIALQLPVAYLISSELNTQYSFTE